MSVMGKKDGRFILIRKYNEGPSIARNVGLDNAKGDYIAFVDGDDIIHVEYIETLVGIVKRKKYTLYPELIISDLETLI